MEAVRPPEGETEGIGGGPGSADSVVIHPHLFPHALKLPDATRVPLLRKQLNASIAASSKEAKEAQEYIRQLQAAKDALSSSLASPPVSDAAVTDALATYVGLLLGLVAAAGGVAPNGTATPSPGAASPDDELAAAEAGASAGASPLAAPPSKLRHAVRWGWGQAAVAPPPGAPPGSVVMADAAFEQGSAVVAAALRLAHAAAAACADSASGVPTPAATRGYQLLRQAAGLLEWAAAHVAPVLAAGAGPDLDPQLLRALAGVALADAQQLTVLRAVAKGNAPGLVAALASDTAAQYRQAASLLESSSVAEARGCKLLHYAAYKQAYCLAYAHCFNGILLWKQRDQCGAGLKCLDAAAAAVAGARRASAAFDAAPPASLNLHHRRVDEELERVVGDAQRRMARENATVFLQPVPAEAAPLPDGKRLASALPFVLPVPAPAVRDGVVERCFAAGPPPPAAPTAESQPGGGTAAAAAVGAGAAAAGAAAASPAAEHAEQGCSVCRWAVLIVCFPVLSVLWVLGAVIWLLLLPLKCCLPCCGFPLQWAADAVLWLLRAPARGLLWATGSREEEAAAAADDDKRHK